MNPFKFKRIGASTVDVKFTLNNYNHGSIVITGKAYSIQAPNKIPPQFWYRVIDYNLEGPAWENDIRFGRIECMGEIYDLYESSCSLVKDQDEPNEAILKLTLIRPPIKLPPHLY
ncbi:hypothetical protein ACTFIZ_009580 [Dictyostelium cf. discoideum]